jgi:hypothetical protein
MNFGFVVRHEGTPFFTSLRLDRAGFTDPKVARRIAEEQVIASGITGTVEIEVGALAAGTVCVDRRVFDPSSPKCQLERLERLWALPSADGQTSGGGPAG